jgi:Primase C terminal 2 (PriCT-2)
VVRNRTEALRKVDPRTWNGKHDEWFELLMGCKAAGIDCEDFVEWSTGDPYYADDADIIRVKWDSVEPKIVCAVYPPRERARVLQCATAPRCSVLPLYQMRHGQVGL